jgi:cytoskeletal protein RodZ
MRPRSGTPPLSGRLHRHPHRSPAEAATRRAIRARDAGLRRINAVTRGLVAAVVALSGALAVLAANGFHGHTLASRTAPPSAQPALSDTPARTRSRSASSARRTPTARAARAATASTGGATTQTPAPRTTQTQTTPAQSTPAQTAPAQTAPAQTAPAQTAPAQTAPAQTTPAQTAPAPSVAQPSQAPAPTPAAPVVVSGGS